MLVLSRKENESITIAGNIRVVVVAIKGNRVVLGVEADRKVPVRRTELAELEEPEAVSS